MGLKNFAPKANRTPSQQGLRFDAFPMGRWWMQWLGDVGFHDRQTTRMQPTISVVIQNADEKSEEVTSIPITVSQLWSARPGTLWVDKVLTKTTTGEDREISFKPGQMQSIAAGGLIPKPGKEGSHIIPFGAHPFHSEHTKSHCLGGFIDGTWYIFPVLELVRFYFGSSGSLLRRLFSADFDVERLVHEAGLTGQTASVTLPADIPWTSAADVARICFCPIAARSATQISRSVLAGALAASTTRLVYADTRFPFESQTTQRVRGIPMQAPWDRVPRFLVQEILSCSAPFPFKALKYACSTRNRVSSTPAESSSEPPQTSMAASRGKAKAIGNQDPKSGVAPRIAVVGKEIRFPDLLGKPIFRVDAPAPSQIQTRMLPPSPLDGSGEGIAGGQGRSLEPVLEPDARHSIQLMKCPDEKWLTYFEWLKRLCEARWVEGLSFVRIHPGQARMHWTQLPELIDHEGEVLEATRRLPLNGEPIQAPRLGSFANVLVQGKLSGLVSLQPRAPDAQNLVYLWPQQRILESEALRAVLAAACTQSSSTQLPRRICLESRPNGDPLTSALEELRRWVTS